LRNTKSSFSRVSAEVKHSMVDAEKKFAELNAIEGGKSELEALKSRLENLERGANGGSGGGGMDARLAKLEANVSFIEKSLGETRTDVRDIRDRTIRLEEKVNHLPSKGFIVTVVATVFALLTAAIIFQDKLSVLIARQ